MPPHSTTTAQHAPVPPLKQKMALGLKSFFGGARKLALGDEAAGAGPLEGKAATTDALFPRTTPDVDGDDCTHDCESCNVKYPRHFKIEESDVLYGHIKGWSTHVLVATGKSDWVRDVEDEKGSVMQAIGRAEKPENGVCSCSLLFHYVGFWLYFSPAREPECRLLFYLGFPQVL